MRTLAIVTARDDGLWMVRVVRTRDDDQPPDVFSTDVVGDQEDARAAARLLAEGEPDEWQEA